MNDNGNPRSRRRLRVAWTFFVTAALVVMLAVSIQLEGIAWPFQLATGIALFVWVCVQGFWVKSIIAPLLPLLQGMFGESTDLPTGDTGPIGEAAKVFIALTEEKKAVEANLKKAQDEIVKLNSRIEGLGSQELELRETIAGHQKNAEALKGELALQKKQANSDSEKIKNLSDELEQLVSKTASFMDAIAGGDYNMSFGHKYPVLAEKANAAGRHISDLSYEARKAALRPEARPVTPIAPIKHVSPAPLVKPAALKNTAAKPPQFTPPNLTGVPDAGAIVPRAKKVLPKVVVSNVRNTTFDGSKEYNRKDFGKY